MSTKITIGNVLESIWENIATVRTKIGNATTSADGLMSSSDKSKIDGVETNANKTTIANNLTSTTAGSALDATQGKVLNDKIAAFQAGVDSLYNKCVSMGVTPSGKTLTAVTNALQSIYNTGYSSGNTAGYNSGYSAGNTAGYNSGYSAGKAAATIKLKYVSKWTSSNMNISEMLLMPTLTKQSDGTCLLDSSTCVVKLSGDTEYTNRELGREYTTTTLS